MLEQAPLEPIYVSSALINLLCAESFLLKIPKTQVTQLHTSGTLEVPGGDDVLEHPSSNDEQQLVNKYCSSLCLG